MDTPVQNQNFRVLKRIVILLFLVSIGYTLVRMFAYTTNFMKSTGISTQLIAKLVFSDGIELKSTDSRTNILLLGIGGGTHAGAELTDTMMVITLDTAAKRMHLLSIPRDIWSETLKDKVNSAYYYGQEKAKQTGTQNGGMLLSKVVVEDVTGIPIHYVMLVDFDGFKQLIDKLGGVDVYVRRAFTDENFPIEGKEHDTCPGDPTNRCVYETIHFDAGVQHMDGTTALKYVRSRHAEGDEGGDFARSNRQQDLLLALKNKILHPKEWFSVDEVSSLLQLIDSAVDSQMNIGELSTVARRVINIPEDRIHKISLVDLLYEPPSYVYGRYVLVPKDSWNSIHEYIQKEFENTP